MVKSDNKGRLSYFAVGDFFKINYNHDNKGQVTTVDYDGVLQYNYEYAQGKVHQLIARADSSELPDGAADLVETRTFDYLYDDLTEITSQETGDTTTFVHDRLNNRLAETTNPNGHTTAYRYYPDGKLKAIDLKNGPTFAMTYDDDGNLTEVRAAHMSASFGAYDKGVAKDIKVKRNGMDEIIMTDSSGDTGFRGNLSCSGFGLALDWRTSAGGRFWI